MLENKDINWGVRGHDLGPATTAAELAERISSLGFRHTQLALKKAVTDVSGEAGALSPGAARKVRKALQEKDVEISVLGCYIEPNHPDPVQRKDHLDRFIEHLRYGRDFDCGMVGTETGELMDIYSEESFTELMKSLEIMTAAAESSGCLLAIEGVADKHTIHSHERMMRVLDLIPSSNLGVIYDPVNFLPFAKAHKSDDLMREAFDLFGGRMFAIHAKDYVLGRDHVDSTLPTGKGMLNYPLLLSLIREYKPGIHVLLENNTPDTIHDTIAFINSVQNENVKQ